MKIPGEILKKLTDAFLDAFDRQSLAILVRETLDEQFAEIVEPGNFRAQAHDLLVWAQRTGRLEELIEAASGSVLGNEILQAACAALRDHLGKDEVKIRDEPPAEPPGNNGAGRGPGWWRWLRSFRWPHLGVLGLIVGILGAVLTTLAWLWPRTTDGPEPAPAPEPPIYYLRIQVLDPEDNPVRGSTVLASVGNEPHRLPDGWWQVEIAAGKLPLDRKVTLRAEHPAWKTGKVEVELADDPNPSVEVRLKTPDAPESRLGGIVFDAANRGIAGARITIRDHSGTTADTDQDGHFELSVEAAQGRRVRLNVEHPEFLPANPFCYAGRLDCAVALKSP